MGPLAETEDSTVGMDVPGTPEEQSQPRRLHLVHHRAPGAQHPNDRARGANLVFSPQGSNDHPLVRPSCYVCADK